MTQLSKAQRVQLFNALLAAFPGWNELKEMVNLQLDRNLETISASSNTIRAVVLDLIVWAQAGGYLGELVSGALAHNPDNPQLKAFAAAMQAAAPAAPPPPVAATPASEDVKEYYERLVWKAVEFAGTAEFRAAMIQREATVCRVEFPEGAGEGTGFLVSPDLLFTNYHVLEDFIEKRQPPAPVVFRFDYQANADGTKVNDGRVTKLASSDWLVRSSKVKDLDYALVRLSEKAGDHPLAGGTRGWLSPVSHTFEVGESVFVLQHPKAAPLKIASGGVSRVQDRRIHYLANTLPGSSGSPCFTSDWKLAALHRGGDDIANIAIPFAAMLADLQTDPAFKFE
jgi:V8-like Glu-specific endopeptidase